MENKMWITNENNEVLFHTDYMLSESIKPKKISYGTDFINEKWKELNQDFYVTFFEHSKAKYVIFYRKGFIGFGNISKSPEEYKTIEEIFSDRPFMRTDSGEAVYIFNFVFYIIIKAIQRFKPKQLQFDAVSERLHRTYSTMVKNTFFLKELEKYRFEYKGIESDSNRQFFTFKFK